MQRTSLIRGPLAALAALALCCAVAPVGAKKKPLRVAQAAVQDDSAPDVVTYGQRDDVMRLGAEIAERRGLDAAWVAAALQSARYVPNVAKFIMPPPAGTAKNWAAYRGRFVEPMRIRAGAAFWRANRKWLALAEELYGVPPEIVVGVIGVETIYAQQMGNFRVIDALATLSFDFPPGRRDRSAFFRTEIEEFFVMCKSEGLDPTAPKGSYAGAMGMPQFMPSSFNKYAVDLDGDGHVDLAQSSADAIGSVAHYLAEFGWQRGMPTRFDVAAPVDTADRAVLLAPDILPSFGIQEFAQRGARLDAAALAYNARMEAMRPITTTAASAPLVAAAASEPVAGAASEPVSSAASDPAAGESAASAASAATAASSVPEAAPVVASAPAAIASPALKLALVELQNGDAAASYVAGTPNFYAITRYNWSSYYAMAVIELGEAVAREIGRDAAR
jgi:membrane-bound lytic murein transglycosylase B